MLLRSNRQLTGDYGEIPPHKEFWCDDAIALQLIERGLAMPIVASATYETKIITPEAPQVAARNPFHFLPVSDLPVHYDSEPPALAAVRAATVAAADVPEPGNAPRRKRGRPPKYPR